MDPITTAALINAGSQVLGSTLKGGGSAGNTRTDPQSSVYQDGSAWAVNFGQGGSAGATAANKPMDMTAGISPVAIGAIALAALGLVLLMVKK